MQGFLFCTCKVEVFYFSLGNNFFLGQNPEDDAELC